MVLVCTILALVCFNVAFGECNNRGNVRYSQSYNSASPSRYGGSSYSEKVQEKPRQYVMMAPIRALSAQPTEYGRTQLPNGIANYFAVISRKSNQGFQFSQGPQLFIPPQRARISPFHAPDQYNFVPPEQQPYQPQAQMHQHPPVLFDQPEFAELEPIVVAPPERPHYLTLLQKQQDHGDFQQLALQENQRLIAQNRNGNNNQPQNKEEQPNYYNDLESDGFGRNHFGSFGRFSRFDSGDADTSFSSIIPGIRRRR